VIVGINVDVNVNVGVNVAEVVDVIVEVRVPVGVIEGVSVKVGETGVIILGVAVGTNGGVGERITGKGDGHTISVATARGMYPPLQAVSRRSKKIARVILVILFSNPGNSIGNSN
jgi:hypothetical protein